MPRLPALPPRGLPLDVARRFAGKSSIDRPANLLTSEPEPAYLKLKLRRGGVWVPAIIWRPCPMVIPEPIEEYAEPPEYWCYPTESAAPPSQIWSCTPELTHLVEQGPTIWSGLRACIGDEEVDPLEVWGRGPRIDVVEYRWRLALRNWAVNHAPAQPEARPKEPVDLAKLPSLF
jgi:hypothetical protein